MQAQIAHLQNPARAMPLQRNPLGGSQQGGRGNTAATDKINSRPPASAAVLQPIAKAEKNSKPFKAFLIHQASTLPKELAACMGMTVGASALVGAGAFGLIKPSQFIISASQGLGINPFVPMLAGLAAIFYSASIAPSLAGFIPKLISQLAPYFKNGTSLSLKPVPKIGQEQALQ